MAAELIRVTETTVKIWHLVAENCTACCSVRPETYAYSFMFPYLL